MPIYEVSVGGKVYEVEAPDEQSAIAATSSLGEQHAPPLPEPSFTEKLSYAGTPLGAVEAAKGALQGAADIGRGMQTPSRMAADWLIRHLSGDEAADRGKATDNQLDSRIRSLLAPERGGELAHSAGRVAPAIAASVAAPQGVVPASLLGGALSGAQTMGETGDVEAAGRSAGIAAIMPAIVQQGAGRIASTLAGGAGRLGKSGVEGIRLAAAERMARLLGVKPGEVPKIVNRAQWLSDKLGVGTRKTLERRAESGLDEAAETLSSIKAKNADVPVPTSNIESRADRVLASHPTIKYPGATAPESRPWYLGGSDDITAAANAQSVSGPDSLNPEALSAAREVSSKIGNVAKGYSTAGEDFVPASELFKARTQLGQRAKQAYNNLPGQSASPIAEASALGQYEISDELHNLIPGLRNADMNYSDLQTVANSLRVAAAKDAVSGRPAAATIAGARELLMLPTGMARPGSSAYGVWQVTREIVGSPLWTSLSARARFKLADAIERGGLGGGSMTKALSQVGAEIPE